MPTRVIAFFLAFVVFWAGLNTIEAPSVSLHSSHAQQHAMGPAVGSPTLNDGSVEDHHLDDQPLQAPNDAPVETLGLLPAPLMPDAHSPATVEPHAFVSAVAGSPFLAGPLRPPRSEALSG